MVLYVDSSAMMKRYVREHDSEVATSLLETDPVLMASRLVEIEVRRNLARILKPADLAEAKQQFSLDLDALALVSIDATTCNEAARIAEETMCKSLDAIHLASALRVSKHTIFLTFDIRQAQAARTIGLDVIGC